MNWKRLIGILREEETVYRELLEMAGEKRTAIFDKNIERLDAVVRREQGAAARLGHWEKQRLACMDAAAGATGSPTLLFFAEQAPQSEGEELRSLHHSLSGLIRELQKANAENKVLIESRLEYVRFALDVLTAEQTAGVYSRYDAKPGAAGTDKNMWDKKV